MKNMNRARKKGLHRQKARIHIQIRRVDLHLVYLSKHKVCVLHDAGATGKPHDQVTASFFKFFLVQQ